MKKVVLAAIFMSVPLVAETTFEFENKIGGTAIFVEVQQSDIPKTANLISSEDVGGRREIISFDGSNKNIDILTLRKRVKKEIVLDEDGYHFTAEEYEQDIIYIAKELTKDIKNAYESKIVLQDEGVVRTINVKVYRESKLLGKTKFTIKKGLGWEGYFNVSGS